MAEILKSIFINDREFMVSNLGEVYMIIPTGLKRMKKYIVGTGYEAVDIHINKVRYNSLVHRLVCTAFHDNPFNHPVVNHIDGNKSNNKANNLEWVTQGENLLHCRYVLKKITGYEDKPVVCVETGEPYISIRDASRQTGVNPYHISEVVGGKRKSAGGYVWKSLKGDDC